MDHPIDGNVLKQWGFTPGPWFGEALKEAEALRREGADEIAIRAAVTALAPLPPIGLKRYGTAYHSNIRAENDAEAANIASVAAHMNELMRVPTVKAGAIMPDACPSGSELGSIPVGAVVATENAIHPGMHSADICCSVAITVLGSDPDPVKLMDLALEKTHFGPGGRPRGTQIRPEPELLIQMAQNPFLKDVPSAAIEHFATQGDGNHFLFIGRLASTGQLAIVTHHGSRKPGAMLYKAGMTVAERTRRKLAPEVPKHNAWIVADSREGEDYWNALQLIRAWTKASHFRIHERITTRNHLKVEQQFWNEHNFVFRKVDGLFYHAKGATPAWAGFAEDDSGLTLIPLNLAEPILITRGKNAKRGLGFAPHGAGRNFSRNAYLRGLTSRELPELLAAQAPGIDVRYYCGIPDLSELPDAYKNAASVRRQIESYDLAEVVDTVEPIGSIMAGDWQANAPWRKKRDGETK